MARRKTEFKLTYQHYADLYKVDLSTIKRWAKRGFQLDDPADVESKRRDSHSEESTGDLESCAEDYPLDTDLKSSLERLRIAEALAGADCQKAREANDEALYTRRLNTWLKIQKARKEAEESQPKVNEANKQSLNIDEVSQELNSLFANLRLDLESLGKKIALELLGADEIKIIQVIGRETGEIIRNLYNLKYLQEEAAEDEV